MVNGPVLLRHGRMEFMHVVKMQIKHGASWGINEAQGNSIWE